MKVLAGGDETHRNTWCGTHPPFPNGALIVSDDGGSSGCASTDVTDSSIERSPSAYSVSG